MKITKLCEYKGDTWLIELDGAQKIYVNGETLAKFGIEQNAEITSAELSALTSADILRKAKKRALYLLGERMMCKKELLAKLTRTYGEQTAAEAVNYICELGYINDEEYAPKLADYLIKRRHWGVRRVRLEMLRRGLERELVENTLDGISDDELDEELLALIKKKYSQKIQNQDDRRRTIAALARRGYDFGAIKRCIETAAENIDDSGDFDDVF